MTETLASFKRDTKPGDVLLCVENTYRPELNGTTRTIVKVGPSVCQVRTDDALFSRMEWPKAGDVVSVTATEITYKLALRDGHTVTLRREGTER